MPHVTVPKPRAARAPRRHHRANAATPLFHAPLAPRTPRLSPLNAVSLQVIVGFLAPLPFIQLGHWLFGWPGVAVMFGGQ